MRAGRDYGKIEVREPPVPPASFLVEPGRVEGDFVVRDRSV